MTYEEYVDKEIKKGNTECIILTVIVGLLLIFAIFWGMKCKIENVTTNNYVKCSVDKTSTGNIIITDENGEQWIYDSGDNIIYSGEYLIRFDTMGTSDIYDDEITALYKVVSEN